MSCFEVLCVAKMVMGKYRIFFDLSFICLLGNICRSPPLRSFTPPDSYDPDVEGYTNSQLWHGLLVCGSTSDDRIGSAAKVRGIDLISRAQLFDPRFLMNLTISLPLITKYYIISIAMQKPLSKSLKYIFLQLLAAAIPIK